VQEEQESSDQQLSLRHSSVTPHAPPETAVTAA